jgi:two-component sensor histidine kinase
MSGGSSNDWLASLGEHPLLRRRPLAAHAVAVGLVVLAFGLRLTLSELLVGVPFITFYSVVAISAFVGGWTAGALATALSVLAAVYFLVPPLHSFRLETLSDALDMAGFALTCALMVLLTHIGVSAAEASSRLARQRQVLLMELQHRIKNHLQLLGAMIATHSRATTNERIRERLEEAGRRLQVIAATYDNLYQPGALIDMSDHLRKVCAFVEGGVASRSSKITVDSVSTSWPVERVIPLSLIANELLTNSVKHALPDTDLAVDVKLEREDGQMRFSVDTLNTRLPDGFDVNTSGLGLKIASMLAQQLGGQLKAPRLPAASFVVEFPEHGGK